MTQSTTSEIENYNYICKKRPPQDTQISQGQLVVLWAPMEVQGYPATPQIFLYPSRHSTQKISTFSDKENWNEEYFVFYNTAPFFFFLEMTDYWLNSLSSIQRHFTCSVRWTTTVCYVESCRVLIWTCYWLIDQVWLPDCRLMATECSVKQISLSASKQGSKRFQLCSCE